LFETSASRKPDNRVDTPPAYDFTDIKEFIQSYIEKNGGAQSSEKVDENHMMLAVLTLLRHLILFGFYTFKELDALVPPLVHTLDGRDDVPSHITSSSSHILSQSTTKLLQSAKEGVAASIPDETFRQDEDLYNARLELNPKTQLVMVCWVIQMEFV
jgi:hypothetical protein